jgi:pumilio RNA-binding family
MKDRNKRDNFEGDNAGGHYPCNGFREERHRSISAPPVDKFIVEGDIELGDIQKDLSHSAYYRRSCKNEPGMHPPNAFFRESFWGGQHDELIAKAFAEDDAYDGGPTLRSSMGRQESNRSLAERIDEDYPESEKSSEYKGASRATTPIGNAAMLDTEAFNSILSLKGGRAPMFDSVSSYTKKPRVSLEELEAGEENGFLRDLVGIYLQQGEKLGRAGPDVDVKELCVAISKDQEGSRFIQKKLESVPREQVSWFFENIVDAAPRLSSNLFGNYVVQKIIPLLGDEERTRLIAQLVGQIHLLSTHPYGCRVIQKLIDCSQDINFIFEEIKGDLFDLIEDQNGNHVIQKCIERSSDKSVIMNHFIENSMLLSTHKYGCRVIQRMLECCSRSEIKTIVSILTRNIEVLVNDQYGNYVIQHVLAIGEEEERSEIIDRVIEKSYELSKYKFSSNVIEQCVKLSNHQQKGRFLGKFLDTEDERPNIYYMCADMYGNYVVQRFYDSCDEGVQKAIQKVLRPYIRDLKKAPFARQILFKINS